MPKHNRLDDGATPTLEMGDDLQKIYAHLNWRLFDDQLPNCMITLKRHHGTFGFFSAEQFKREDGKYCDEIALNARYYDLKNPLPLIEKLTHEMVHLWQFHFGSPGRGRYHNREWADKMIAIGLQPTDSGFTGGRETGDTMYQIVMPEGRLARASEEMLNKGTLLRWTESIVHHNTTIVPMKWDEGDRNSVAGSDVDVGGMTPDQLDTLSKSGKRVKYACPDDECRQSALSQHSAVLKCGIHDQMLVAVAPKKRRAG